MALATATIMGDRAPFFGQSCLGLSLSIVAIVVLGHLASDLREKRMLAPAEASNSVNQLAALVGEG